MESVLKHIKYIVDPNVTEEELDREIWKNTKWDGMSFSRESDWNNYGSEYASPVFAFENGDRVVIDKQGNIVEL